MSKAFGLANIRFGYLLASEENIQYISSIRNPKNITTFAQEAVIGALSDVEYMQKYVQQVNAAKAVFINSINSECGEKFHAYESNANFVLIKCDSHTTKTEILDYLEDNNVFIRDVSQSQSVKNCVRVTMGNITQMECVIKLFKKYVLTDSNSSRGYM
jgi:histidinol-phosphate aminotransferase